MAALCIKITLYWALLGFIVDDDVIEFWVEVTFDFEETVDVPAIVVCGIAVVLTAVLVGAVVLLVAIYAIPITIITKTNKLAIIDLFIETQYPLVCEFLNSIAF
jgi:hypothetical protein